MSERAPPTGWFEYVRRMDVRDFSLPPSAAGDSDAYHLMSSVRQVLAAYSADITLFSVGILNALGVPVPAGDSPDVDTAAANVGLRSKRSRDEMLLKQQHESPTSPVSPSVVTTALVADALLLIGATERGFPGYTADEAAVRELVAQRQRDLADIPRFRVNSSQEAAVVDLIQKIRAGYAAFAPPPLPPNSSSRYPRSGVFRAAPPPSSNSPRPQLQSVFSPRVKKQQRPSPRLTRLLDRRRPCVKVPSVVGSFHHAEGARFRSPPPSGAPA